MKLGLISLSMWLDRKPQDLGFGSHVYLLLLSYLRQFGLFGRPMNAQTTVDGAFFAGVDWTAYTSPPKL
jgi:hypothetical protein